MKRQFAREKALTRRRRRRDLGQDRGERENKGERAEVRSLSLYLLSSGVRGARAYLHVAACEGGSKEDKRGGRNE